MNYPEDYHERPVWQQRVIDREITDRCLEDPEYTQLAEDMEAAIERGWMAVENRLDGEMRTIRDKVRDEVMADMDFMDFSDDEDRNGTKGNHHAR